MEEIIDFKVGPQIAGTIVRDSYGVLWKVLKNISYATAQPKEGQYYTKYVAPAIDYQPQIDEIKEKAIAQDLLIEKLTIRIVELERRPQMSADVFSFNTNDFYLDTVTKTIRKR